jgi:hypothetical protein
MIGPLFYTRTCEFGDDCAAPGAVHLKTAVPFPTLQHQANKQYMEQVERNLMVKRLYRESMAKEGK